MKIIKILFFLTLLLLLWCSEWSKNETIGIDTPLIHSLEEDSLQQASSAWTVVQNDDGTYDIIADPDYYDTILIKDIEEDSLQQASSAWTVVQNDDGTFDIVLE